MMYHPIAKVCSSFKYYLVPRPEYSERTMKIATDQ
uniref:Uncharacterized protein n=1 Tax=Arundo donax TaxID=35708 RepID=A0A0A8YF42_ARUDO